MNRKKYYLVLILLTIICGAFLNWKFCCNVNTKTTPSIVQKETPIVKPVKSKFDGISIIDKNGNFKFKHPDNFNFLVSSYQIEKPISTKIDLGLENLKNYLIQNPNKNISITGHYKTIEKYNGALPNLGYARATSIKNYMVEKKIPSKQINLYSKLDDALIINDKTFKGPISFNFTSTNNNFEEELKILKNKIQKKPLVLYFKTGESNISLSAIQKQKIADISKYLDKTNNNSVIITGHTDNIGNAQKNTILGQKRAEFAKNYLIQNGIPRNKIITNSKGPLNPIADNSTSEGRSKNRRTVITIN